MPFFHVNKSSFYCFWNASKNLCDFGLATKKHTHLMPLSMIQKSKSMHHPQHYKWKDDMSESHNGCKLQGYIMKTTATVQAYHCSFPCSGILIHRQKHLHSCEKVQGRTKPYGQNDCPINKKGDLTAIHIPRSPPTPNRDAKSYAKFLHRPA